MSWPDALWPGSCYQPLRFRKMSPASLDHQQIVGVVKRVGEGLLLLEHLYPVDTCDAQCFGAAVQLAGILNGNNDAARRHPDLDRHPVSQSRQ